MELPIKQVYDKLLQSSAFLALIPDFNIYLMDIPEQQRTANIRPLLRLTEINDYQTQHASNTPLTVNFTFQIDVWDKSIQNIGKIKTALDSLLNTINLTRTYSVIIKDEDLSDTYRLITRYQGSERIKLN